MHSSSENDFMKKCQLLVLIIRCHPKDLKKPKKTPHHFSCVTSCAKYMRIIYTSF